MILFHKIIFKIIYIPMPKNNITISFTHKQLLLLMTIVIIAVVSASFLWTRAAFIEPTVAPASSEQDFAQNILGANSADNAFDSGAVTENPDGSIVERLESLSQDVEYARFTRMAVPQKNQIWDDWKGSEVSSSGDLATAYAATQDMNKEESTWTSETDASLGSETIASGEVMFDTRTGLYWSDCYSSAQDGICDTITNDFALNGIVDDANDGLDAEGGNSVDFCEALLLDADGDGTDEIDWYLPGQKELMIAYVNGIANNVSNPAYSYWSSTESYEFTSFAWHVYFRYGYTDYRSKTGNGYARCVHR